MKLKRDSLAGYKNPGACKVWMVFLLLLTGLGVTAQDYSVSSAAANGGDPNAAEVVAPAAPDPGRFVVSRSAFSGFPVEITYKITGTATLGNDYETVPNSVTTGNEITGTLTIPGFQNSAIIDVNVLDDNIVENPETVVVTLDKADRPGTVDKTPAQVTISDVTDVGTFSLDLTEPAFIPNASEEGPTNGRFRIVLDKPNGTAAPVTVNYTLSGTAATDGSDYSTTGAVTMTFNNDPNNPQVGRNLNIVPIDDEVLEDAETVTLTLNSTNNPGKFRIGTPNTAEITIADNDCNGGDVAPTIIDKETNFCGDFTVQLDSYSPGARPPLTGLVWTTNENDPLNQAFWPPRENESPVSEPGVYFAFFWDEDNSCNSPLARLELTQSTPPSAGTVTTPITACNNDSNEFGPNRVDLDDLIEDEDDGDWAQTGGPDLGNLPNNHNLDFRGEAAGSYEFTYTTNTAVAPCTEATAVVTITVTDCDPCLAGNTPPVLTDGIMTTFCGPITNSLNDYAPNIGPNDLPLRWATDDDDPINNLVPANRVDDPLPGTYFGFYYDAVNDCTSPLLTLSLVQNETPEITGTTENSLCGPGTMQLRATANLDATIRWYTAVTGGTPVRTGANFTTPNITATTSYFVEATANGCTSERTEVIATIIPQPSAGAPQNTSSCNDAEFGVTILDLDDTFTGTPDEGAWSLTDSPSPVTLNAENVVDFQGSANGNYVFTYTTTNAEAPCENVSAEVTIAVSSCDTDDDGDGLLGGLEAMLGTDPNNVDTDGDGINDDIEVGNDTDNPLDEDGDGIIDALDSNTADADGDGVNDQQDPANDNACVPDRFNGQCDTDGDGVSDLDEQTNGSDPDDACDPNATPNCADPIDLQVLKEVDIPDAVVGDQVVFTVTVNNLSERKAINVMVGDLLETGFQIDSTAVVSASSGEYDTAAGIWTIPEIAAMGSETLALPVRVLENGLYENTAELLASIPEDATPDNNTATVTLNIDLPEGIDLVLEKTAAIVNPRDSLDISEFQEMQVNPLVGQEIIFKLKVTNVSENDTVSRIVVRDSLAPVFSNPRFTPELTPGSQFVSETGVLTWRPDELPKNGVAELEIRVFADSVGTYLNIAEIIGSSPLDTNQEDLRDRVTVNVSERTDSEIGIIFNQFSPNNDGVNDDLKINKTRTNENGTEEDVDIEYSIKIFNRYGSLIFEGDQLSDEVIWNGTREGKNVPEGTYFYVLNVTLEEEVEGVDTNSTKKGWIQLIR